MFEEEKFNLFENSVMYAEARKIHLIKEVLKITSEATLTQLETVLENSKRKPAGRQKKASIYDFVGMLTKKEADGMRKTIEETKRT